MNSNISKIHFINSTGVSLNDRFTAITKVSVPAIGLIAHQSPRVRSNSVSRMDSNRQLVDLWDRSQAMQSAMHLKNTAIRRSARQRLQRNTIAQQMKRTMGKIAGGFRRLQRSTSFSDIATMNADHVLLQRARGKTASVVSRLGTVVRTTRGRSVSRGRSATRNRSTSRGRKPSLSRANSQLSLHRAGSHEMLNRGGSRTNLSLAGSRTNLSRVGSRNNLSRAESRTNLSRAGSRNNLARAGSRNGLNITRKAVAPNDARRRLNRNTLLAPNRAGTNGVANRSRSRSRSRARTAAAATVATANSVGGGRGRARKQAGSRGRNMRSGSVNSRLGTNRTNEPVVVARRTTAARGDGRVSKRSASRRRARPNATAVGTRVGRPLKRETINRRGAGGKKQQGNGNASNGNGTAAPSGRRGRSRSRRANSRVRGRSASKNRIPLVKQQPKSREELDNELDQYMANTRTLDKEMEEYINVGVSRM